jgi:hypothetical protein
MDKDRNTQPPARWKDIIGAVAQCSRQIFTDRPIGRAALATLAQGTSFGTAANVWNFYA